MEFIKMDDPRLDESFSFLFAFKKGATILKKDDRSLRAEISDGVYIGEFPKPAAGVIRSRGKTLYEIKLPDAVVEIVDETEIENIADES
jgi:hypothetical protein